LLVATVAGLRPDMDAKEAALLCQRAEQDATGVQVGIMDQFTSALGRRGYALLLDCETLEYSELPFPYDLLIAVIDSGVHRRLADTPYNVRRREAEAAVARAGMPVALIEDPGEDRRLRHLVTEVRRVRDFADALRDGDREWMGRLLDESHASLRDDFEVSTPELDQLVDKVRRAHGCLGARIMGAGFGGSVLALVDLDAGEQFKDEIDEPMIICSTADGAFVR
jgi:galactokinase